jgi:hypothetical protein
MVPPDLRSRKAPLPSPPMEKETVSGRAPPLLPLQFDLTNTVPIKGLHEPHTPHNVCEVFLAPSPRVRFASWSTWSRTTDVSLRLRLGFSRVSYVHYTLAICARGQRDTSAIVRYLLLCCITCFHEGCGVYLSLRIRSRTVDIAYLKWMCKVKVVWNP